MYRFISIPIVVLSFTLVGFADSITLTGVITQSQNDQPGNPAISNPTLNNINDGEAYSLALNFAESMTTPGSFALSGGLFSDPNDPAGNATESGFGSGTLVSRNRLASIPLPVNSVSLGSSATVETNLT